MPSTAALLEGTRKAVHSTLKPQYKTAASVAGHTENLCSIQRHRFSLPVLSASQVFRVGQERSALLVRFSTIPWLGNNPWIAEPRWMIARSPPKPDRQKWLPVTFHFFVAEGKLTRPATGTIRMKNQVDRGGAIGMCPCPEHYMQLWIKGCLIFGKPRVPVNAPNASVDFGHPRVRARQFCDCP